MFARHFVVLALLGTGTAQTESFMRQLLEGWQTMKCYFIQTRNVFILFEDISQQGLESLFMYGYQTVSAEKWDCCANSAAEPQVFNRHCSITPDNR